jgi:hypothetical protein
MLKRHQTTEKTDQGVFLAFGVSGGRADSVGLNFPLTSADGWNGIFHGWYQCRETTMPPQNAL